MSASATWTAGEIPIAAESGPVGIAGWLSGHFGIDFRPFAPRLCCGGGGWVLTHLPTGYAILGIAGDFATAALVVADVAEWGDWDFTDRASVRKFRGRLEPLEAKFPERIVPPMDLPAFGNMVAPAATMRRFLCAAIEAEPREAGA